MPSSAAAGLMTDTPDPREPAEELAQGREEEDLETGDEPSQSPVTSSLGRKGKGKGKERDSSAYG